MRGSFEGSLNAPRLKMVDTECVREVVQSSCRKSRMPAIASSWDVGRLIISASRPDAFHVFIYAPFHERVRRLRSTGKSEKEALELAETVDRDRADFIKRYFDVDWPGRHRFHLMVNSGMGNETAVEIILDAACTVCEVEQLIRNLRFGKEGQCLVINGLGI